jgi:hypothetical protein
MDKGRMIWMSFHHPIEEMRKHVTKDMECKLKPNESLLDRVNMEFTYYQFHIVRVGDEWIPMKGIKEEVGAIIRIFLWPIDEVCRDGIYPSMNLGTYQDGE